jgi:hypothetical protein
MTEQEQEQENVESFCRHVSLNNTSLELLEALGKREDLVLLIYYHFWVEKEERTSRAE